MTLEPVAGSRADPAHIASRGPVDEEEARGHQRDGHGKSRRQRLGEHNRNGRRVRKESRFMTDEGKHYRSIGRGFAEHGSVTHSADEYVHGDIHTNTVEGL